MKVRGFWFKILMLLGTSIICVSPNNSTLNLSTSTTRLFDAGTSMYDSTMKIMRFQTSSSSSLSAFSVDPSTNHYSVENSLNNFVISTPINYITSLLKQNVAKSNNNQNTMLLDPSLPHAIQNHHHSSLLSPSYLSAHKKRDTGQNSAVPPCNDFEIGDMESNTFTSPRYPNNYPKNIDCVRVIQAPEEKVIRLDFRNTFHIEYKEDCGNDFLEIRDGPYGYSELVKRFCGEQFPDVITSSGRYLWLHFHSDDSIEYTGFKAVYEFLKRPEGSPNRELNCTILKEGPDGHINSTDVPPDIMEKVKSESFLNLDCMWVVRVEPGWKIQIKFLKFSLERPNDCQANFVDIFKEHADMSSRLKNFCGSAGDSVQSENHVLNIRFFATHDGLKSDFSILYTVFREKGTIPNCEDDEIDCDDGTCISGELKCNRRDNCKFRTDEEGCFDEEASQSEHVVIIIVVFALILGGMMITFLVRCIRKLYKDQKIIREHLRQSKESRLDEMGRASAMRSKENLATRLPPSEKHSQSSFQILDGMSHHFYREIAAPLAAVRGSKTNLKKDDSRSSSILRTTHPHLHRDINVQTSLCDDATTITTPSSPDRGIEGGTCEMACQTRESLFQPILQQQKSIASSSPNQSVSAIRFSTFGYDAPPPPPPPAASKYPLQRQSTNKSSRATPTAVIELEDLRIPPLTEIPPPPQQRPPPELCHHHHQHQQHLQQQQQTQQQQQQQPTHQHHHHHHHTTTAGKGNKQQQQQQQKVDETKVLIDIRNSAPDVIIMTSH